MPGLEPVKAEQFTIDLGAHQTDMLRHGVAQSLENTTLPPMRSPRGQKLDKAVQNATEIPRPVPVDRSELDTTLDNRHGLTSLGIAGGSMPGCHGGRFTDDLHFPYRRLILCVAAHAMLRSV